MKGTESSGHARGTHILLLTSCRCSLHLRLSLSLSISLSPSLPVYFCTLPFPLLSAYYVALIYIFNSLPLTSSRRFHYSARFLLLLPFCLPSFSIYHSEGRRAIHKEEDKGVTERQKKRRENPRRAAGEREP